MSLINNLSTKEQKAFTTGINRGNFYKDVYNYSGVDGRVYQIETQPEAPMKSLDYDRINHLKQA